jgi:transcriptional regulator NrdR family protein
VFCPICSAATYVRSTEAQGGNVVRRRECIQCGHRFTTLETPEIELKRLRAIEKAARALSERLE